MTGAPSVDRGVERPGRAWARGRVAACLRRIAGLLAVALAAGCSSGEKNAAGGTASAQTASECIIVQQPVMLPGRLSETSGVAFSRQYPGVIWTHNDSGSDPMVVAVDSAGELLGRVRVTGADNRDWEDIALGPCPEGDCLFIADVGDNDADRDAVTIWKVPEPAPGDRTTAAAEPLWIRYPEGPRDAEAIFALPSGDLFIITKGRDHPVVIYRYAAPTSPDSVAELERVRVLHPAPVPHDRQVTAAAATADGRWIAIRTYTALAVYRTEDLLGAGEPSFASDLRPLGQVQGESVAVRSNGEIVLTSEGGPGGFPGSIARVRCDQLRGG